MEGNSYGLIGNIIPAHVWMAEKTSWKISDRSGTYFTVTFSNGALVNQTAGKMATAILPHIACLKGQQSMPIHVGFTTLKQVFKKFYTSKT
jgi:hypothetical protein